MKNLRENQAHNDALRGLNRMPDNRRIKFLLDVAATADGMRSNTNPRVCQLQTMQKLLIVFVKEQLI